MNSMIIFLAHIIAEAGFRVFLLTLGTTNIFLHIFGGIFIGLLCPLLLVPIAGITSRYLPRLTNIVFPVKSLGRVVN